MNYNFSLRSLLAFAYGSSIALGIIVVYRGDRQRHDALEQILLHYGLSLESIVAGYPIAYAESQATGLFVRVLPGSSGTLRSTYYRHADDELVARDIAVLANPKFEFTLTIIGSACNLAGSSGWIGSAAWSSGPDDQSVSHEIFFESDEIRRTLCSTPGGRRTREDRLAGAIYLIPPGDRFGLPLATENLAAAIRFCKEKQIDVIVIEYFEGAKSNLDTNE